MGTLFKAKLGELEDEFRELFSSQMRKELTGVVQGVSGKRRLLVMFKDGCNKDIN